MSGTNAELITQVQTFMDWRLKTGKDNDIRGHIERLISALETAEAACDAGDTEEFCAICLAGTRSSEHLSQPHGEGDR